MAYHTDDGYLVNKLVIGSEGDYSSGKIISYQIGDLLYSKTIEIIDRIGII